ncbi:4-methyl-5(B-hydroxyethyl)-thiazole monophosphate biosynthesis protein [Methylobacillus sp. MM3]|uniref:DJ-1 family glyoxalase III n=1 Tax=Methylobacillus sp. MM3 TaxID=1848039 RepID=UPI0007DF5510|nr:DJ-1 family glyoxalase III [Methylobacillus sp. MM3]OAJ69397.1 4-methyl-5(B-hydroxyethyl)-thiazole monophosphate biosynthesis protein [Methylobacillus sp. MM3]
MTKVLIPLAQGCEELEAVTVIDILRRAGIQVITAGLETGPVRASRGTVLLPDATLDDALENEFDMIVLPGGMPGSEHLKNDKRVIASLQKAAAEGKYIAAICAAPMALHAANLLQGKKATSFPGVLDAMPGSHTYMNDRVVVDGRIVTSKGPGTAMDFALTLVELLVGKSKRDAVESDLQR